MVSYVIDSSVAIKWLVPEVFSPHAIRFFNAGHDLHTPTLFDLEMASICWKKIRRGAITQLEGSSFMSLLPRLTIKRQDLLPLIENAFAIADATNCTVYDCSYIALAERMKVELVTADSKLVNTLANTPWAACVVSIASFP